ncbi:MAG TPA: hypothetical protein VK843_18420, partial [Planctomycetota bacterium]|nr:hypothetical protein [Planctomycetota bacterium]
MNQQSILRGLRAALLPAMACMALGTGLCGTATAQSAFVGRGQTAFDTRWHDMQFSAIGAGVFHTPAIDLQGQGAAWGNNNYGGCTPAALPPGVQYTAISAGYGFTVALRSDGSLGVWGSTIFSPSLTPPTPPLGVTYVAVSAGGTFIGALRSDGRVVCWGTNYFGESTVPALP